MTDENRVVDNPDEDRYELWAGEKLAGIAQYDRRGDLTVFTHTEIDDAFEGRGLGSTLVRAALDAARTRGLAVRPDCPFVRGYVARHTEYLDLVPEELRPRLGL